MTAEGTPPGVLPPHRWVIYFKEGGVGTFLPLYHSFLAAARGEMPELPMGSHARLAEPQPQQQQQQEAPSALPAPRNLVATA